MIKMIGKHDYGLYTLANSLIVLFMIDFGLGVATNRYVAKYRAESRQDKINSFLGAIYKLYIAIDIVIAVALFITYFCLDAIYVSLSPEELMKFKAVYILAATFAVLNFPFITLNGIISSYEKFIQLKLADISGALLHVGAGVVVLLNGYGLLYLVAANVFAGVALTLFKLTIVAKCTPVTVAWRVEQCGLYREIFRFSFWVMVAVLAQRLIFNITPSILGIVANSAAIAIFGIVVVIEGFAYTITTAVNNLFIPRISRIYSDENPEKNIMPLMLFVGKFQYMLNGLIVIGFLVLGKEFIEMWLDPSYLDAYYGILLVMIPGLFFNPMQIANNAMTVQKKVSAQAYIGLIVGAVNVIFSFVFAYYYGVIGACLSIFIAYMLRDALFIIAYERIMKFDMRAFLKKCYPVISVIMMITTLLALGVKQALQVNMLLQFILVGTFMVLVYGGLIFKFAITPSERSLLLRTRN